MNWGRSSRTTSSEKPAPVQQEPNNALFSNFDPNQFNFQPVEFAPIESTPEITNQETPKVEQLENSAPVTDLSFNDESFFDNQESLLQPRPEPVQCHAAPLISGNPIPNNGLIEENQIQLENLPQSFQNIANQGMQYNPPQYEELRDVILGWVRRTRRR